MLDGKACGHGQGFGFFGTIAHAGLSPNLADPWWLVQSCPAAVIVDAV
jgi:hypothetical protein